MNEFTRLLHQEVVRATVLSDGRVLRFLQNECLNRDECLSDEQWIVQMFMRWTKEQDRNTRHAIANELPEYSGEIINCRGGL